MIQSGQLTLTPDRKRIAGEDSVYYVAPNGRLVALPAGNKERDVMRRSIIADPNHRVVIKNSVGDADIKQWRPATEAEIQQHLKERAAYLAEKHQLREQEKLRKAPAVMMVEGAKISRPK